MPYPEHFSGFQAPSAEERLDLEKHSCNPRPFNDNDVDVLVECCTVSAHDLHTLRGDWGKVPYPLAVGHELVGKVLRVGPQVKLTSVGQSVGVGAQVYSCLKCRQCKNDNETYCKDHVMAYAEQYPDIEHITQDGWSSHARVHEYWVYPIPDSLSSSDAAPMMSAGITVYSPLRRFGAGGGKKIGVIEIGGLGHYAVMFGKALGAEVWAISRSRAKEADARQMGADGYLVTSEKDWNEPHKMTFHLIINTANSFDGFQLSEYLSLLDVHGRLNSVGAPGGDGVQVRPWDFIQNGWFMGTTNMGSRREMLEMLDLAAAKGTRSWVETIPISREGIRKAIEKLQKSSVRYRSRLIAYENAFDA